MKQSIMENLKTRPVIAAVQNERDIDVAISSGAGTIFLLCADIFNAGELVRKVEKAGKKAIIHMDFLEGIGRDTKAIDYIAREIRPHGIISTKSSHIKVAASKGLFTVQRFFLIDNKSFEMAIKNVASFRPDMVEIMPGVMPSVISRMNSKISIPVIAGGLIDSEQDVRDALAAGAVGVSTGKKALWSLK